MIQSKPIPFYPGYTLIWDGNGHASVFGKYAKPLTTYTDPNEHLEKVCVAGTRTTLIRLCALTWLGLPPRVNKFNSHTFRWKFVALPINGDYLDLRPENVEWRTKRWFARNILSSLDREDILEIRHSTATARELAEKFNVHFTYISHIRTGRVYADVKESLF